MIKSFIIIQKLSNSTLMLDYTRLSTCLLYKVPEASWVEFLVDSSKNSVQHGQPKVVTFLLALLKVLLTDELPILMHDELTKDGVAADGADKAVGMKGNTTDSQ